MTGRLDPLAELTYTSFDPPTAGTARPGQEHGGWQIKDLRVAGAPAAPGSGEEQALMQHLRSRLQPIRPVPKFPDSRDLANRTRRLVHRVVDGPVCGLWHTVDAGVDASGRPGNVFVHALLYDGAGAAVRAIDTWRCNDWLTPYGAAEVAAAAIGSRTAFTLGTEITPAAIVDFLTEPPPAPDRIPLLGALLDATAAALSGGAAVLIVADSADEAAAWIGAISHCASAPTANTMAWSTFERAADLDSDDVRNLHLVAVPREDVPSDGHGRIVIALDEEPSGEQDDHWTLASGQQVARTPWSALAMSTLARDRRYALAALEALRPSPAEHVWVRPGVALGLHVLATDTSAHSPARLTAEQHFVIDHLCAQRDADPAAALAYVSAAVGHEWWLFAGPAPVPATVPPLADTDVQEIRHVLAQRTEQIATAATEQAAGRGQPTDLVWAAARGILIVDFCVRAGLAGDERLFASVDHLAQIVRWASGAFGEPFAREVWSSCGAVDPQTMRTYFADPAADAGQFAAQGGPAPVTPVGAAAAEPASPLEPEAAPIAAGARPARWWEPLPEQHARLAQPASAHLGSLAAPGPGTLATQGSGTATAPVAATGPVLAAGGASVSRGGTRNLGSDWVPGALELGGRGAVDAEARRAALAQLEALGLRWQEPFMLDVDVLVRPAAEQVALAVLASCALPDAAPPGRLRKGRSSGEHRLVIARHLVDGGDPTMPRLAGFAVETLCGAALVERSGAVTPDLILDPRAPYGHLLEQVLLVDARHGRSVERLLLDPPTDAARQWRDFVAGTAADAHARRFLWSPQPKRWDG